jgi:hypothetical protein
MSKQKSNEARRLAMKARVYRSIALLFVIVGILIFAHLYTSKVQGHFLKAIQDPFTITIFLFPFIPAVFLSWIANVYEKKYDQYMRKKK